MRIARVLFRKMTPESFDFASGQIACWVASILVLCLGFLKLGSLPLSEAELFFGLLLVLAVALLGVNLGFLLRIEARARQDDSK